MTPNDVPNETGFGLERFVLAQDPVWKRVCAELRAGRKTSHWMWYVFPQIAGLGLSEMSRRYAISGLQEARAYLAHPVLGPRLREATALVCAHEGRSAYEIMGSPDDAKLRSCMTLFADAAEDDAAEDVVTGDAALFCGALERFYGGEKDPETMRRLA